MLVLYASSEGQTRKIAEYIAQRLRDSKHETTLVSGQDINSGLTLESFDGVVIGASVHMGSHPDFLKKFVKQHIELLKNKPTAFFSVCMMVRNPLPEKQQEARQYVQDFIGETGWEPNIHQTFAGAIKYSKYGFFMKMVMKRIARKEGADTDTSRDYEYTDWEAVTEFARDFSMLLDKQVA